MSVSGFYGWTYARQARTRKIKPTVRCQPRPVHPLQARWASLGMTWALGRVGRVAVTVLLLAVTFVVFGKEPLLRAEVTHGVIALWQSVRALTQTREASAAPMVAAAKPLAPAVAVPRPAKPLALVLDQGLFLLDVTGTVWPGDQVTHAGEFPIVTGVLVQERPGRLGIELFAQVDLPTVRAILGMPFADQVSEIHFGPHEDIVLYTRDAIKILLPQRQDLQRDLRRLAAVIEDIRVKGKNIAMVDLRYERHVVVRPRQGR